MDTVMILICLFVAMLIGSTLGFGDALILIPFIGWIVGVQAAIVLSGFWGIYLSVFNLVKYRQYRDWTFLKTNILSGLPGIILGSVLINYAPVVWIQIILGAAIFIFSMLKFVKWWKLRQNHENEPLNPQNNSDPLKLPPKTLSQGILITGGFSYGFFGGLIGASGPINVILLEETGHSRESLIGNFAISSALLTIIKMYIYFDSGLFPENLLLVYLLGIPIIFAASRLGHYITPKIPVRWFEFGVLCMLLGISIRLIFSAL